MLSPRHVVRNARLLLRAGMQHVVDDPALLAVQVSRRLPMAARLRAGRVVRAAGRALPAGDGVEALGAVMLGDLDAAQELVADGERPSRLRDEVAVLISRQDLLGADASPRTRARAAWTRGDLDEAVEILVSAGLGSGIYARRLRSELRLLAPGYRLPVSAHPVPRGAEDDGGLRVLHLLTNSLPHTQSGYSLRTHRILTFLRRAGVRSAALTRTGYPVMVGIAGARDVDEVDGIPYMRTVPSTLPPTPQGRLLAEVERALELVDELRPHVIHTTTNYHNALVAQAVSEATGIPWVLEVRGLMEQTWIASQETDEARARAAASQKVRLIAAREAELARSADAVITLSRTMVEELVERGVPEESITVVPNGVDPGLLAQGLDAASARAAVGLELPADAVVVGAVSAIVDYEGFDVLIRAAAQIIGGGGELAQRLHVLIVGDGTAAPGLRDLAQELGIYERVHMPGRVARQSAADWVQSLDLVAVPRVDREVSRSVTPQKPIEALALGRPVVVSDLPALRETVTDAGGAVHAMLVPPGDPGELAAAIRTAVSTPGEVSRELARSRSWPELVRRFEQVYGAVIDSRGGRRDGG